MANTQQGVEPASRPMSARLNIVGWILATVALALIAMVLTLRALLIADVENSANASILQEIDEFEMFLDQAKDPATAKPFTDTERLFKVYLSRQLPGDDESLMAIIDGRIMQVEQPAGPAINWQREGVSAILNDPAASGVYDTSAGNRVHWAKLTLTPESGGVADHFIVAQNTGPALNQTEGVLRTITFVGVGGLLLTTVIAWLVAGRIIGPIRELRRVASNITETDLSARVPVKGTDENMALAETFNSMLDRIEAVHEKQSRFVDDAGHELRTPITVVRGQLELLEQSDEEQRQRSVELSINELDRMARIVNELLTLAVADRTDFVEKKPVDVADLTIALEDKAQVMAERDWRLTEVCEITAPLDEQRITQAMLEICNNAVRHTNEGDRIDLGSRLEPAAVGGDHDTAGSAAALPGAGVTFWVRDYGEGIPAERLPQLFERFSRFGSSKKGSKRTQGAGLGLSIVQAIAEAHGGRVWVDSEEGEGSTFGVTLPLGEAARVDTVDVTASGGESRKVASRKKDTA